MPRTDATTAPRQSSGRAPELDLLRFFAVGLVLVHHLPQIWVDGLPKGVSTPVDFIARIGWIGVDLFFVLSGFLVSGLLFNEYRRNGAVRPIWFLMRRGFKIYPAFWALLAGTICAASFIDFKFRWHGLLWEFFFLQNYGWPIFAHTWSLAVEEHFYILLTILIAWLAASGGPDPFRRLPHIIAVLCGIVLAGRCVGAWIYPTDVMHLRLYEYTHHRLDGLALGVALAYWRWSAPEGFSKWSGTLQIPAFALTALVLLALNAIDVQTNRWVNSVGLTLIPVTFALLLAAAPALWDLTGRPVQLALIPVAWIGRYSYSIYLWHTLVRDAVDFESKRIGIDSTIATVIYILLALGFGIGMALLVEMPALRIRDRFFPSRSS